MELSISDIMRTWARWNCWEKREMTKTLVSMRKKKRILYGKYPIWSANQLTYSPIKRSTSSMSLAQNARHRQSGSDDYTSRSGVIPPRMGMIRRHTTSAATSPPAPPTTTRVSDLPNFPQWDEILVACPNLPEGDLRSFWQGFEQHQQDLVDCIDRLALDDLERSVCRRVLWKLWS
jgi:hypothetical protein